MKTRATLLFTLTLLSVVALTSTPAYGQQTLEINRRGINLKAFHTNQDSTFNPNHVWIGAINTNDEAMTCSGLVTYTKQSGDSTTLIYTSKFSSVLSPHKGSVVWERDGEGVQIVKITNVTVQ